jgi:hypothetical protein
MRGEIDFPGGALRMSLTPAMTLFDVDGNLPQAELAIAGVAAAARAIRRLGIAGSIGIDLPTLSGRADRQAAAAALDAALPQPFERTAVNGFGFLQIGRRRERPSLAEIVQGDPAGAAARALRAGAAVGRPWLTGRARGACRDRADRGPARLAGHARASGRRSRRLAGRARPRHIGRACPAQAQLTEASVAPFAASRPRPRTGRSAARGAATATS